MQLASASTAASASCIALALLPGGELYVKPVVTRVVEGDAASLSLHCGFRFLHNEGKQILQVIDGADKPVDLVEGVDRFLAMTQELLDYSRGNISLQTQEVQVGRWLDRIIEYLQEDLEASNVALVTKLEHRGRSTSTQTACGGCSLT